jgi:hypothetical protein
MKRIEIFASQSVQDELVANLENAIPNFYYTLIPAVHGRGKKRYCLGTSTWPEENFILIAYLDDGDLPAAEGIVAHEKKRYPNEGLKIFVLSSEQQTVDKDNN